MAGFAIPEGQEILGRVKGDIAALKMHATDRTVRNLVEGISHQVKRLEDHLYSAGSSAFDFITPARPASQYQEHAAAVTSSNEHSYYIPQDSCSDVAIVTPPDVVRVANPFGSTILNLPHEQTSFMPITQDEAADSSFDVHSLHDNLSVTSLEGITKSFPWLESDSSGSFAGNTLEELNEHPRHEDEREEEMPIDRLNDELREPCRGDRVITPDDDVSNYGAFDCQGSGFPCTNEHVYEYTTNAHGPQVHDTFANSVEACLEASSNNASTDFFDAKDAQAFTFNRQMSNELLDNLSIGSDQLAKGQHRPKGSKRVSSSSVSRKTPKRQKLALYLTRIVSGTNQTYQEYISQDDVDGSKICLCGKGGHNTSHDGTMNFRTFAEGYRSEYNRLPTPESKEAFTLTVLQEYYIQDGRFFRVNKDTKAWEDMPVSEARKKIGQFFRDQNDAEKKNVA